MKYRLIGKLFRLIAIIFVWGALGTENFCYSYPRLKQILVHSVTDSNILSKVDLLFDGKVNLKDVQSEFFGYTIQLSLSSSRVYPSKIANIQKGLLTKIFAYQFLPDQIRCRFTLKENAENFRNEFNLESHGNVMTVLIKKKNPKVDLISRSQAHAVVSGVQKIPVKHSLEGKVTEPPSVPDAIPQNAPSPNEIPGEKELLQAIKARNPPDKVLRVESVSPTVSASLQKSMKVPLIKLVLATLMLVSLFFVVIKFKKSKALLWTRTWNSKGRSSPSIQIQSSIPLGTKKNLCVVSVDKRKLLLGVTQDSIRLITELDSDFAVNALSVGSNKGTLGTGAESAGPVLFSDMLHLESEKPVGGAPKTLREREDGGVSNSMKGVKEKIRSKLENLRPI